MSDEKWKSEQEVELDLDALECVAGGATPEVISQWNAEYAIYKDRLVPGTVVPGTVKAIADYGVFVDLIPGTLMVGLGFYDLDRFRYMEVGHYVTVYIRQVIPEKLKIKIELRDWLGNYKP